MQRLLAICDRFADEYHTTFNAGESKCSLFVGSNCSQCSSTQTNLCTFKVGGNGIESVDTLVHLDHVLNVRLSDDEDIKRNCGAFIGQVNKVLCYFAKLTFPVKYNLFRSCYTSFNRSELWLSQHNGIHAFIK
jgi:hypothetical protein